MARPFLHRLWGFSAMTIRNKRCDFCHRWYAPDPRIGEDQVACQREECRKKRKARADRNWRIKHPGYGVKWKYKLREWAANYPDYWKHYRKTHPECADRERRRMRSKRERLKSVAKQDARRQIAVERLEGVAKPNATDLSVPL